MVAPEYRTDEWPFQEDVRGLDSSYTDPWHNWRGLGTPPPRGAHASPSQDQYPDTPQTPINRSGAVSMTSSSGGGWHPHQPQTFPVTHADEREEHSRSQDFMPRRGIHDSPPIWDGKDPAKELEPYLKC